jgi:photosystem II stability/assembly factor-like uncharacterized protein
LPKFKGCIRPSAFFLFLSLLALSASGQSVPSELVNGLKWRLLGPFRGGRAVAVAGVPGDPTTFYFGSVNGGVWKTTDAGTVWSPIFDGQPAASIGALAIAPSDPNTIFAGTGESDIRSSLSFGNGVYVSHDGGKTWTHVGLEETRHISRIVVDPQNPNIVYVGSLGHVYAPDDERGVFKSVDGGAHWKKVLDQGKDNGVSDLTICATNPQLLFAGTWHTWRPPWSTYAPIDGPGSGLFRSRDGGETWSRLEGRGLPEGDWGRVGVAAASDGKRVYALLQAKQSGLYRSDDGGDSWVLANSDPRLTSRAWYFSSITVDPSNPDVFYVPNVALYRSEDGGKTISVVRGAPGGDDYHQIWIDPKNSSSMVLGTDQGTTITLDRGQTWTTWYNQPTAQFYHIVTDNQFPYVIYGTQQDSGSAAVPIRTDHGQITPRDWFPAGGSESGYMVPDPQDPNIVFLTSSYGGVARYNRHTGFSQDVTPWPVTTFNSEVNERKYRAPWAPVLVLSPVDPKTMYFGTQYVMKTLDGGLHWEKISPDLTGAEQQTAEVKPGTPSLPDAMRQGYGSLSTIAPSPRDRSVLWSGSDTGLIHLTRDGGKSWKDVTPKGLSEWSKISLIEASHFNPAVAYAAVDRSRLDDETPHLYRTRDYGANWQAITDGLTAPSFLRAVREDPQTKGLLFAGTEFGIYVSFDDGDHWQSLQLNLPVTSIRDLTIHGDDLIVATHGRAFWALDDITPLRQISEGQRANAAWLYRPAVAFRIDNDVFVGTPLPPEEPTAENPPSGAVIDYFLKSSARTVKLEIFDGKQQLVRSFSSERKESGKHVSLPVAERWFPKPQALETTPGMHRFVWDLTWRSSGGPDADEDADYRNPRGPKAAPGNYQVRLTVDGQTQSQTLQVKMDPRSSATQEILVRQLELGRKIFGETLEARRAMAEMTQVQKQLGEAQEKAQDQNLKTSLTDAQGDVGKILSSKPKPSDQAQGLQEAYSDLASALRVVESGDRAIPAQASELYEQSSEQVKKRLEQWKEFKQARLPKINEDLRRANLTPVAVAEIEREVEFLMTQ